LRLPYRPFPRCFLFILFSNRTGKRSVPLRSQPFFSPPSFFPTHRSDPFLFEVPPLDPKVPHFSKDPVPPLRAQRLFFLPEFRVETRPFFSYVSLTRFECSTPSPCTRLRRFINSHRLSSLPLVNYLPPDFRLRGAIFSRTLKADNPKFTFLLYLWTPDFLGFLLRGILCLVPSP